MNSQRLFRQWAAKHNDSGLRLLFLCKGEISRLRSHVALFHGTLDWENEALLTAIGADPDAFNCLLVASFPSKAEVLALLANEQFQDDLKVHFPQMVLVVMPPPSLLGGLVPIFTSSMRYIFTLLQSFNVIAPPATITQRRDGKAFEDGHGYLKGIPGGPERNFQALYSEGENISTRLTLPLYTCPLQLHATRSQSLCSTCSNSRTRSTNIYTRLGMPLSWCLWCLDWEVQLRCTPKLVRRF